MVTPAERLKLPDAEPDCDYSYEAPHPYACPGWQEQDRWCAWCHLRATQMRLPNPGTGARAREWAQMAVNP